MIDYWSGTNPVLDFIVKKTDGMFYPLTLEVKQLVHCGRTSKNTGKQPAHTALAPNAKDAAEPVAGPLAFIVPQVNATCSTKIKAYDKKNNTEVEPVILFDNAANMLITVGCDHADRALESIAGAKSKLWSPKIMAAEAWLYSDIKDHWDKLILQLWGYPEGTKKPYMNGKTGAILPPERILEIVKAQTGLNKFQNTVIFCGSIPFMTPEMMWGPAWDFELFDPILNRYIRHHYDVDIVW